MAEESKSLKWGKMGTSIVREDLFWIILQYIPTLESGLPCVTMERDKGIEQRNVKETYALLSLAKNRKYACGKHATSPWSHVTTGQKIAFQDCHCFDSFFYNPNF